MIHPVPFSFWTTTRLLGSVINWFMQLSTAMTEVLAVHDASSFNHL
jgi:hypothetical protein